ncbi:restriction endonuclease [Nocardia cyriacigeorgica]|uniref:restriction endonuclease n=1 Tax=Nocardia cyriacigeorgica TaxID=135487 RepID=UPI0015E3E6B3|nr:restriction endonuclease [Nocardia cyriacigeorgica]
MKYIETAYEAEENAAVQMRSLGYEDARVTERGADGGIDVRATGAVAQVKWRAGQVGRPELQRLFGARGKRYDLRLFFFAAAPFTAHAIEYADDVEMALFTYDPTGRVTPVNATATKILVEVRKKDSDRQRERRQAAQRAQHSPPELRKLPQPRGQSASARQQRAQAAEKKAALAEARIRWATAINTGSVGPIKIRARTNPVNVSAPGRSHNLSLVRSYVRPVRNREEQQHQAALKKDALVETRRQMQANVATRQSVNTAPATDVQCRPVRYHFGHLLFAILSASTALLFLLSAIVGPSRSVSTGDRVGSAVIALIVAFALSAVAKWQYRKFRG